MTALLKDAPDRRGFVEPKVPACYGRGAAPTLATSSASRFA
jgi:hypothetical protein